MAGEFDFIRWVCTQQASSQAVPVAAGDDLAVLKWAEEDLLLVGVDQVLDGVHFDSAVHSPRDIGAKVINRNLSDCAAMACLPAAAVVAAALPQGKPLDFAKELYLGIKEAGERFNCPIVGGDTGTWRGPLALSVSILGRSAGVTPITRRGAKPGDGIYVTGALGGSILGRHLRFVPRINEARLLASRIAISAMIDLSDGLSRDLAHICSQSGVGALLEAHAIPIHADAVTLAARDGLPPLHHALHDGEDHELLFMSADSPSSDVPTWRIGTVAPAGGVMLRDEGRVEELKPRGWEHQL